jgi:hypothetical protein
MSLWRRNARQRDALAGKRLTFQDGQRWRRYEAVTTRRKGEE